MNPAAAPVGEPAAMPPEMPAIEIGDWVRMRWTAENMFEVEGVDFDCGDGDKLPFGGGTWFLPYDVLEIRKANGVIWRRTDRKEP